MSHKITFLSSAEFKRATKVEICVAAAMLDSAEFWSVIKLSRAREQIENKRDKQKKTTPPQTQTFESTEQ